MNSVNFKYDFVPGPSPVPAEVLDVYTRNYSSPDLLDAFPEQYASVQRKLSSALGVESGTVVIQSGEGMLALWGAMKSCVQPGDKVLSIATGVFGYGFADMAKQIGAEVSVVGFEYNETAKDLERIRSEIDNFKPKLVTIVHCETPSGTLNPIAEIGPIVKSAGALYYVDFVASAIGVPVNVEEWCIDLGLLGTQKCLSLPPDLSIITVSPKAWKVIENVNYCGYDALKPWKDVVENKYFPYTHNWRAIAALEFTLTKLEAEGFDKVVRRHEEAAAYCRKRIIEMGLDLFPKSIDDCTPTVTAVKVPTGWKWEELDAKLREEGVIFGGSYEKLSGVVFRIGHMGSQTTDTNLLEVALNKLQKILKPN